MVAGSRRVTDPTALCASASLGKVNDPLFPVEDLDLVTMIWAFRDFTERAAWLKNVRRYLKDECAQSRVPLERKSSPRRDRRSRIVRTHLLVLAVHVDGIFLNLFVEPGRRYGRRPTAAWPCTRQADRYPQTRGSPTRGVLHLGCCRVYSRPHVNHRPEEPPPPGFRDFRIDLPRLAGRAVASGRRAATPPLT